jgi:hypothetical protein
MITTGNLKRKPEGQPQSLRVLTTSTLEDPKNPDSPKVVRAKTDAEIRAGLKIQRNVLASRVQFRPTHKTTGPMLVTGGMEGRVQNEKRKQLMEKLKMMKARERVKTEIKKPKVEIAPTEEKTVVHEVKAEIKPDGTVIALEDSKPDKKKRGRPKKEAKEKE